jgi:hypothetical protein
MSGLESDTGYTMDTTNRPAPVVATSSGVPASQDTGNALQLIPAKESTPRALTATYAFAATHAADVCRISNGSAVLLVEYGASGPYSGAAV